MARVTDVLATDARPTLNPFARPSHPPGVGHNGGPSIIAQDEVMGAVAGWAFGQSQMLGTEGVAFLGYAYLAELSQRPEYRRIVETISNEMTRRWIRFVGKGDEDKSDRIAKIEAEMKRLKVRDAFRRGVAGDGYFGRGHVYIDLGNDDANELTTDIGSGASDASKAKIARGSLKALRAVEALWVYPTSYDTSNPLSPNWYRPGAWMVQGRQVHASRILTMIGRELPDILKPAYSFGGLPLTQMVKLYVDNWLRTRQSVSDLVASFSVSGIKTDLSDDVSTGDAGEDLLRRVQFFSATRSNLGTMILNKDEEFFNVQTALGTLDKLQAQSLEQVGSAAKIPLVKFTGLQPSGLNASSEGELDSFYDDIHGQQEQMVRPGLTTVIDFIQLSLFGDVDPDIGFEFEHLQELDEAEAATVSKTRAETDAVLVGEGIILPEESRKRLAGEFNSPYAGLDLSLDVSAPKPGELDEPPAPLDPTKGNAWREAVEANARAEAAWAEDAGFEEGDHPRASNGQFGHGSGSGSKAHVIVSYDKDRTGVVVHHVGLDKDEADDAEGKLPDGTDYERHEVPFHKAGDRPTDAIHLVHSGNPADGLDFHSAHDTISSAHAMADNLSRTAWKIRGPTRGELPRDRDEEDDAAEAWNADIAGAEGDGDDAPHDGLRVKMTKAGEAERDAKGRVRFERDGKEVQPTEEQRDDFEEHFDYNYPAAERAAYPGLAESNEHFAAPENDDSRGVIGVYRRKVVAPPRAVGGLLGKVLDADAQAEAAWAQDDGFEESAHPRASNGQFGSGGSSAAAPSKAKAARKEGGSTQGSSAAPGKSESAHGEHHMAASSLYAEHAGTTPKTEVARKARGAEIAEKMGATQQVAAARQKLAGQASTDANVSNGGHRQDDGSYTPERRALHEKLLAEVFTPEAIQGATPESGEKPVMTMLGGRGGSGKSWLTSKDGPADASKSIVVDADHFKGRLPEYQGWNAGLLHEESSHLVDRAAEIAEKLGLNVVFDATMKSAKGAENRIAQFEAAGHDVHGHYMFASPETATERALGRFARGGEKGRFVPPEVIMENTENEKNFDRAIPKFKKWSVYDNNGSSGGAPRHVASGTNE